MLEWSDDLSIGNSVLDEQHKAFFGLARRLNASASTGADKDELRPMLADLVAYEEHHFVEEEQWMMRVGYPNVSEHQKMHDAAAAQIHDALIGHIDGPQLYGFLLGFLNVWLVNHVMGADKAFADWLARNPHQSPAVLSHPPHRDLPPSRAAD